MKQLTLMFQYATLMRGKARIEIRITELEAFEKAELAQP